MTAHEREDLADAQVWVLYADINTRFNLLIDECAHLQNTVFGYFEQTTSRDLGIDADSPGRKGERAWVQPNMRDGTYNQLSSRERTLRHLWNSIGTLAIGLEANQEEVTARYTAYVQASAHGGEVSGELYWFIELRGHFIHDVFSFYLDRLQHAHEKLVQLVENMPGTLPGPVLLRRWSSAAYVDFLSTYSREVNWEIQDYLWRCLFGGVTESDSAFRRWRSVQFMTHSWSHVATSLTTEHTVNAPRATGEATDSILTIRTIWSAYFYLEQPVLLPLLYHECAHHFVKRDAFPRKESSDRDCLFFVRKAETTQVLIQTAKFPSKDERAWADFVDEVWTDVIAVRLGGLGYVQALALQIIGLSGRTSFSTYDLSTDRLIPLQEIGTTTREVREVPWPDLTLEYFWEARLLLAIDAYLAFHGRASASDHIDALLLLIDRWRESGQRVHSRKWTSAEHETFWNYRTQLNDWARSTCARYLGDCYDELGKLVGEGEHARALSEDVRRLIQSGVEKYQKALELSNADGTYGGELTLNRLESVCAVVRMHLARAVIAKIRTSVVRGGGVQMYTRQYASYIRNDGSAAFRLCFEWLRARADLCVAIADCATALERPREETVRKCLWPLVNFFYDDFYACLAAEKTRLGPSVTDEDWQGRLLRETRDQIYLKRWIETDSFKNISNFKPIKLVPAINQYLKEFVTHLSAYTIGGEQVSVGTLSLGVLRGDFAADSGDARTPYRSALKRARRFHAEVEDCLKARTKSWNERPGFGGEFMPLLGDYSFLHYLHHNTLVERDCHPPSPPKAITKSRLVVRVLGNGAVGNNSPELPLGRLTQIRFKYRWEWFELAKLLKHEKFAGNKPTLFLSTGWEDVFLILWHRSEAEWIEISKDLDLGHRLGQDTQTHVVFSDTKIDDHVGDWKPLQDEREHQAISGQDFVDRLNQRTGRYDLTLIWGENGRSISAERVWRLLVSAPREFWKKISAITTAIEVPIKPRAPHDQACEVSGGHDNAERFVVASHILLKH